MLIRDGVVVLSIVGETYEDVYINEMIHMKSNMRDLLRNKQCHGIVLRKGKQPSSASSIVRNLVKLDRQPVAESLEGLKLLRQAWDLVDLTLAVSGRYKVAAKVGFLLQITLTAASIIMVVSYQEIDDFDDEDAFGEP